MQKISIKRKLYRILVVLLLILAIIFTSIRLLFQVKEIKVTGAGELYGLSTLNGKPLIFIRSENLSASLLERNPNLSSVSVSKKYPSTLVVTAIKASAVALLNGTDGYFVLSEKSRIMEKIKVVTNLPSLPVIKYYQALNFQEYNLGETLTQKDIVAATQFTSSLKKLGVEIVSIDILDLNMIVLKAIDKQFIFTVEKDTDSQLRELEAIIQEFDHSGRKFVSIDLRFNKPVVKL